MFNRKSKKEYSKGKILYCNERVKNGGEWKSKTKKIQIKNGTKQRKADKQKESHKEIKRERNED